MKILIVDDDVDQRQIRALLLSQVGFDVLEAGDAASAKTIAGSGCPKAAVVDLRLPTVEDGLALIRDLKAMDSTMRIIVLTGSKTNVLEMRPERLLVEQLLIKPAPAAYLIAAIRGESDRRATRAAANANQ